MALADILIHIDMPTYLHDVQTTATMINMWETDDPLYRIVPKEWNIRHELVSEKLEELMSETWNDAVKQNFLDCLIENLK